MSPYKLTFEPFDLHLKQPFTISRDTKNVVHNVLVKFTDGMMTGLGEAGPNVRYDEDAPSVKNYLKQIPPSFFDDLQSPEDLAAKLDHYDQTVTAVKSARAAVETAWLDWWGQRQGKPLWKLFEAPSPKGPQTSFTIGLDITEKMKEKVRDASDFPIYKVKLGTDRDRKIIQELRSVTDKPIRVDANEGWESIGQAKEMITFLEGYDIELIEQPMPASCADDLARLKTFSPIPICADESFMGGEPLEKMARSFDVINIKLMKIGSVVKALQVMKKAPKMGLKTMVGCMIESSIANTAGALLSLWTDYADLDGHVLIQDDPASGLSLNADKYIELPETPGLGVHLR